jgi:hypothetical protein
LAKGSCENLQTYETSVHSNFILAYYWPLLVCGFFWKKSLLSVGPLWVFREEAALPLAYSDATLEGQFLFLFKINNIINSY